MTHLFHAARRNRLEFLLEVIPSKVGAGDDSTTSDVIKRFYSAGVFRDWWKLEPLRTASAWQAATTAIRANDPRVRGVVVLGLDAPEKELATSFALAAAEPMVKGFAVGRTIFAKPAREWMAGRIGDDEAVAAMVASFRRLCNIWGRARENAQG